MGQQQTKQHVATHTSSGWIAVARSSTYLLFAVCLSVGVFERTCFAQHTKTRLLIDSSQS